MTVTPLAPETLYHRCDPDKFAFETTDEMENLTAFIGQPRAVDAIQFAVDIRHDGYNVFALGEPGTRKVRPDPRAPAPACIRGSRASGYLLRLQF